MSDDKLRNLLKGVGSRLLRDDTLTEKKRVASTGSSAASESSSVVIHKDRSTISSEKQEQPLRIRTKNLEVADDDDFNDYVIESPLPPPKELQPGKLYALYEFSGDDPSHCELDRDDAVVLLNDQDNYWWLVRKEFDGKIGFAPAECLETYDERLARLNCWKNEELEKSSKENLETFVEKSRSETKLNKSVAFSSEVTVNEPNETSDYDDDFLDTNDNDDDSDEDHEETETGEIPGTLDHFQKNHTTSDTDIEHEASSHDIDANSDVLSDNFPVTPLVLKKKPKPSVREVLGFESDVEESPFVQPSAFFSNQNNSGSIGTYSPSSSEMDSPENTPPLDQYRRKPPSAYDGFRGLPPDLDDEKRGNIPQSKGTRDIANSMKMLDDLINDELNTTATLDDEDESTEEGERDVTLTFESEDEEDDVLRSPIVLEVPDRKNLSNLTNSTYTNSNSSLQRTSTSTSMDQHEDAMDIGCDVTLKELVGGKVHDENLHPEIVSMFKESLSKMDELEERLKRLNSRFA